MDSEYILDSSMSQYEERVNGDFKRRVLSLMALNKMYLDFIDRLVAKVDRAIEKNRQMQAVVKSQLLSRKRFEDASRNTATHLGCYPPYFKDFDGMAPRHNMDSMKIMGICKTNPLMPLSRPWTEKELNMLRNSVAESLYENAVLPLNSRLELLLEKLQRSGVEEQEKRVGWFEEIEQIKRRTLYLKEKCSDQEFMLKSNYEDVDWQKISVTDFANWRSVVELRMKWYCELAPHIRKDSWTQHEDCRLKRLISRPWLNWDVIADELSTGRSAFQCFERAQAFKNETKPKRIWSVEEDEKLYSLVETLRVGEEIPWAKIASYLPGRLKRDCRSHYERHLLQRLKKGRWTITEDLVLLSCVNKYGPQDWPRIASIMQNRSAIQCRDRFINVLDQKRRNLPWLWEEHLRLFCGIRMFGANEYAKIALLLPGRNNVDVKHRIRALCRFKLAQVVQDKISSKPIVYQNMASNFFHTYRRREAVQEKFRQFSEIISHFDKTSQQIDMRMGIGSFMLTPNGESIDYSVAKRALIQEFGKFVSTSGRWISVSRNPNEFGSDELNKATQSLPLEKRHELAKFLRESDIRYTIEREEEKRCPVERLPAFYNYSPERIAQLNNFIDEYLTIDTNEIINYHRNRVRPKLKNVMQHYGEVDEINEDEEAHSLHLFSLSTARFRKRKAPNALNFTAMAPKRTTSTSRFCEEIRRSFSSVPLERKRFCILRNLFNYVRRSDETNNLRTYERGGLKTIGLNYIIAYLWQKIAGEERTMDEDSIRKISSIVIKDMVQINRSELEPRSVRPSTDFFRRHTGALLYQNRSGGALKNFVSNLMFPCVATCNTLTIMQNTRRELCINASRLFDVVDLETLAHRPLGEDDELLDIRLSSKILNSYEYVRTKTLIYQLFFLPLLMKLAIAPNNLLARRHQQRTTINQRRTADHSFVNIIFNGADFCENTENDLMKQSKDLSDDKCQVFLTYDNDGVLSMENEQSAEQHVTEMQRLNQRFFLN